MYVQNRFINKRIIHIKGLDTQQMSLKNKGNGIENVWKNWDTGRCQMVDYGTQVIE